jgi:deazaflavin-dependent oxidoreductase (nitroreductase family)
MQRATAALPATWLSIRSARRWRNLNGVRRAGVRSGGHVAAADRRYIAPTRMDTIFNKVVAWLTRAGVSVLGSRILRVRGRSSGQWRSTPVNLLTVNGQTYLVAPRGTTQWVRNIRAAGGGELRVGRRVTRFTVQELPDTDKPLVIRAYLKRWAWEVGRFFEGLNASSPDEDLLRVAPGFPVFRVITSG